MLANTIWQKPKTSEYTSGRTVWCVAQGNRDGRHQADTRAHGTLCMHAAIGEEQQKEGHDGKDSGDEQDAVHADGAPEALEVLLLRLLLLLLWRLQEGLAGRDKSCNGPYDTFQSCRSL